MPHLFDTLTVRGVTLRNRIGVSPMCQYCSSDGRATPWHMVHLGARAVGGAGLVVVEATAVEPRGRISPGDAGLWNDDQAAALRPIVAFMKEHGAVAGIQLAHAGRKASAQRPWEGDGSLADDQGGWETIGPSELAFGGKLTRAPRAMSTDDMRQVLRGFADATRRAADCGFQWLELHAAHGYLLHSFHSPLSNKRTDEYGGSLENRTRLTIETVRTMRQHWPDHLPMSVRLSCTDWEAGGFVVEEAVELARKLKAEGVDMIDCSSGFGTPNYKQYPFGPGWQVPLSEAVRKGAAIATATVGAITEPAHADEIIRNGRADVVLLAREMRRDPHWPVRAAKALRQADKLKMPAPYGHWI